MLGMTVVGLGACLLAMVSLGKRCVMTFVLGSGQLTTSSVIRLSYENVFTVWGADFFRLQHLEIYLP